jgi:hypothetical protein
LTDQNCYQKNHHTLAVVEVGWPGGKPSSDAANLSIPLGASVSQSKFSEAVNDAHFCESKAHGEHGWLDLDLRVVVFAQKIISRFGPEH